MTLFLTGCSGSNTDDSSTPSLNGQPYVVIADAGLTQSSSSISGKGLIMFNTPLDGISEKHSFSVDFNLGNSGVINLHTFMKADMTGALSFGFQRFSPSTLSAFAYTDSSETLSLTSFFNGISPSGNITLHIDVHNDESSQGAHVLIWAGDIFTEETALYNSANESGTPGNGLGQYFGLYISDATVTNLQVNAPLFDR